MRLTTPGRILAAITILLMASNSVVLMRAPTPDAASTREQARSKSPSVTRPSSWAPLVDPSADESKTDAPIRQASPKANEALSKSTGQAATLTVPRPGVYTYRHSPDSLVYLRYAKPKAVKQGWEYDLLQWSKGADERDASVRVRRLTDKGDLLLVAERGVSLVSTGGEGKEEEETRESWSCTRSPALVELRFPLRVGSRWATDGSACEGKRRGQGGTTYEHASYEVVRWEQVTVGSVEVACAVVESTWRFSLNTGPYTVTMTTWVARDNGLTVRRVARRGDPQGNGTTEETTELVSMKPRA